MKSKVITLVILVVIGGIEVLAGFNIHFRFVKTCSIAVYPYETACPPIGDIDYTIHDNKSIQEILVSIDYKIEDGLQSGATPNAYLYLKDTDGNVKRVVIVAWEFIIIDNDWKHMIPISPEGSEILKNNLHKCSRKDT